MTHVQVPRFHPNIDASTARPQVRPRRIPSVVQKGTRSIRAAFTVTSHESASVWSHVIQSNHVDMHLAENCLFAILRKADVRGGTTRDRTVGRVSGLPGHALIIPRGICRVCLMRLNPSDPPLTLVDSAKWFIDQRHRPDGYNIGVNVGAAAGQTVFHLHIHLIPRFVGDVDDPRGGVRHVIPPTQLHARPYGRLDSGSRPAQVTSLPCPTAEEQVAFLGKVERFCRRPICRHVQIRSAIGHRRSRVKHGRDDGGELDLPIPPSPKNSSSCIGVRRSLRKLGGRCSYNILQQNTAAKPPSFPSSTIFDKHMER